jgi:glycosyltransferase involved in cell wall biosynthesis
MNVWLIKDGENLPVQPDARKMRTWMLAEELVRRGHRVTWWSSTHSHQRKTLLSDADSEVDVAPGLRLKLLSAGAYRNNKSLRRLLHHARLAAKFRREAGRLGPPDVIVSAFPTIELAHEAVAFAKARGCPVIVDIRDPWPDTIVDHAPPALRTLARLALLPLETRARASFRDSDSLVACSQGFLDWGLRKAGMAKRPSDRVFYLGNSPQPATIAPSAKVAELAQQLDGKTVFCFVGSFGHAYELGLVCDAARSLERRGLDKIHVVLAGDGEQFASVSRAAKELRNLSAPGWLTAGDADHLLRLAHVGLAPIRQTPGCVPNKIFEYSAAGLPILSSLVGETEDILSRNGAGLTYAPGDAEAFLSHIVRLGEDEQVRSQMARNSATMFKREFLATRIYGEYVLHVESIAQARPH